MYKEIFPQRLKKARENTGFSQKEIGKEIGIHESTLAKYELGMREPDIETLAKLADFYNVSIDWLVGLVLRENKPNYGKEINMVAQL